MRAWAFLGKMVFGIIAFLLLWEANGAAGFPEKPIQALVGWPVGSLQDTVDRAVAKPLSKILKQPVIVQNVPGGGGALVLGRVKIEKPDGYTLFATGSGTYTQIPWTRPVPYDALKDFAYLASQAQNEHYLLCHSDSSFKTFEELIQYAKKNPKKVTYGTTGVGTPMHIMMEYLALKENLQWIHVPYSSGPEVTSALLGRHVELEVMTCGPELEHVKTGRFRPLLCLNAKRMEHLPDLPTVLEKGYDFACWSNGNWTVPANTPKDIQKILERALLQSIADPEVKEVIKRLNKKNILLDSETTTKAVIEDHRKFGELMKKFGLGIFKK